jgi:para-nitrobenzyl esterase
VRLQDASLAFSAAGLAGALLPFAPMHGTDLLPYPVSTGLGYFGLDKPLLIGTTADEFGEAATESRDVDSGSDSAQPSISDLLFRAACARAVTARARVPSRGTWLYRFDMRSPTLGRAGHCMDVPFFLGTTAAAGDVLGPEPPADLAAAMFADLRDFVRGSDPGWPAAAGGRGDVTRIYGSSAGSAIVDRADVYPPGLARLPHPNGSQPAPSPETHEDTTT